MSNMPAVAQAIFFRRRHQPRRHPPARVPSPVSLSAGVHRRRINASRPNFIIITISTSSPSGMAATQRLALRRLIKKSSIFFPLLIAATSHLGLAPLPAQVSPDGLRYFGGTFLPFKGPICFGVTDEDICHQVESAGLGIITTNYTPPKIHNKFRLCLPNNKTRA